MSRSVALYIHIPFCKSICSYCDFCKVLSNNEWINQYLDCLDNEIKNYYMGEKIKTIYIGGGTPSALNIEQLEKLFQIVKQFDIEDNIEFTFECNLNDISEELLDVLIKNGVNRLSIGIESFDKDKLKFMNRNHTFNSAKEKINLCRLKGINNINLDLIYGIPNETLKVLKKDLKLLLKLKPNHISTYSLQIEKNTMLDVKNTESISEDLEADMYEYICRKLKNKGFRHYEVSNFSLSGYESKHNLTYWNNEEYYGFGLNASGFLENVRYENTRNLNKYLNDDVDRNQTILSKQDFMDNELMLGLRKIEGINLKQFEEKYDIKLEDNYPINTLLKNKDLIKKNGYIFINPRKLYLMNEILLKLI